MMLGAALLAAGSGSRFDHESHKLRAPFRGRSVVAWSLAAMLGAGFSRNAVVTGAVDLSGEMDGIDSVALLSNPAWADGQASSLQTVLAWARGHELDAVVVGLADQPMVPSAAWRAVGQASGAIVTARFGGQRRPPVRLARSVWDLLPTIGDDGARTLMRSRPDLVSEVPCPGNPADIDTLEDLQLWS